MIGDIIEKVLLKKRVKKLEERQRQLVDIIYEHTKMIDQNFNLIKEVIVKTAKNNTDLAKSVKEMEGHFINSEEQWRIAAGRLNQIVDDYRGGNYGR